MSMGGDTAVPHTATRSGCATLPSTSPLSSATWPIAAWITSARHSDKVAKVLLKARRGASAVVVRFLPAALSS